jgi:hypothetical protein
MLQTASEVWKFLRAQGGIDLAHYDEGLVAEMRRKLNLQSGDFETELQAKLVSVEDFLAAFFQAAQPYSVMMADLLGMFEKANARETNKNLAVRFDFGKGMRDLQFDLRHFRAWIETWRTIEQSFLVNVWNSNTIWLLSGIVREIDVPIKDPKMRSWLKAYERGFWPTSIPSQPMTGLSDLDDRLGRVWTVWTNVVAESGNYGRSRDELKRRWLEDRSHNFKAGQHPAANEGGDRPKERWPLPLLGWIDSDNWAGSLALGAYYKAERIASLAPSDQLREASSLVKELDDLFARVTTQLFRGLVLQGVLEEFLKLPIWQRRHELYSAWIATQIVNAFEGLPVKVHSVGDALLFSFSGTHLASVSALDPTLHLWAELRSPLDKPVGAGRRHAIQPDYSLVTDPVTDPQTCFLVVECKQYLAASSKNFSNALTDYANGRPEARVILVNYGKANQNILNRVDERVRKRTSIIEEMRPGSETALRQFKLAVRNAVQLHYELSDISDPGLPNILPLPRHDNGEISLSWGASPADLDLHLRIETTDGISAVSFEQTGSGDGFPWASLDNDIRTGYGPETIKITRWLGGKYTCAVKRYSDDSPLAGSGARVVFTRRQSRLSFTCPTSGSGKWWLVFSFDPTVNHIEAIDTIVIDPW